MQLPVKLSRYAAVVTLLLKHRAARDDHAGDHAEQLATDLEQLGPTFVNTAALRDGRLVAVKVQRPGAE